LRDFGDWASRDAGFDGDAISLDGGILFGRLGPSIIQNITLFYAPGFALKICTSVATSPSLKEMLSNLCANVFRISAIR
jgi:hypothetical protein